ncbi:glycosyltransferase family 4 protein [Marine Group I thaumarchaeote]|uniref:Glycosyltransferase family 4 protein n=1 Tax=Marine Group I thaumarchaeote TaxID=2511932 RepID=A0A7K4NVC5_9ARCH|nr:glycosyltransferase family 4 protein [Marine Group I thaumarchaeote]
MNILFISPVFSGGIGGHAAMLADKLSDYGYKVKKMQVPHIPIKNLKNPSFALFSSLKSLTNRESFDIVHGFNIPSAYAMKYAKGKKKVLSIHGVFSEQVDTLHSKSISSVAKIAEAQVLNWPDKLTTDSKATQKLYKEKFGLNFEYLPSPLDIQKFSDISDVTKIENQVAYVGRDSYEKGIDIIKQAESKIDGRVIYCTDRSWDDAMKIIKSSQVVVVPSRMESLPTTVKEAFYLNVPVIATDVGGIPELVKDNETGILVPSENPDRLADAVNELLSDKQKAKRLANNGNKFVKNHMTWDIILPKYIQFYEELLATS